ncbi:hypothetical protein D3C87_1735910 [compost metagenome]
MDVRPDIVVVVVLPLLVPDDTVVHRLQLRLMVPLHVLTHLFRPDHHRLKLLRPCDGIEVRWPRQSGVPG